MSPTTVKPPQKRFLRVKRYSAEEVEILSERPTMLLYTYTAHFLFLISIIILLYYYNYHHHRYNLSLLL